MYVSPLSACSVTRNNALKTNFGNKTEAVTKAAVKTGNTAVDSLETATERALQGLGIKEMDPITAQAMYGEGGCMANSSMAVAVLSAVSK